MTIIAYLIPISIALAVAALAAFFWSVRSRQYIDLEGDKQRILYADDLPLKPKARHG